MQYLNLCTPLLWKGGHRRSENLVYSPCGLHLAKAWLDHCEVRCKTGRRMERSTLRGYSDYVRLHIADDILAIFNEHYGVGVKVKASGGEHENIAWKDFCEDVERSKEFDDIM